MEEIYSRLDHLQRVLEASFNIPLTDLIIINQEDILEIISQIQECIPKEIEESIKIKKEETSILEQAEKQADEILKRALEIKENKIKTNPEVQEIIHIATQRINKARQIEDTEIKEVQDYTDIIFDNIARVVEENINSLKKSREILKERKTVPQTIKEIENVNDSL